jgi:glycosyltransferase involved in cell wall biosynthesis
MPESSVNGFPHIRAPLQPENVLPWELNQQQYKEARGNLHLNDFINVSFSLVIPIYNAGGFLEKTIRSILYNNLENIQIIVSDGGSNDNTHEILRYYQDIFDIIISEPDKGQSDAINKGFSVATGELLGWLNGDDLLLPYALDFVRSNYLELGKPNFVVGDAYMVEKDLSLISHKQYSDKKIQFDQLLDWATNHLVQPSVFFSKKAWDEVGPLDIHDHYAMDADLFLGLAQKYTPKHLKHPGLSYSVYHKDCKTRGKQAESITQLSLIQCKYGGYGEAKKSLDYLVEIHNQYKETAINKEAQQVDKQEAPSMNSNNSLNLSLCDPNVSKSIYDLNIGIFNTFTAGGAAIAADRLRVGLSKHNFNVQSYSLFNSRPTGSQQVIRHNISFKSLNDVQRSWIDKNIKPAYEEHGCTAQEQFSICNPLSDRSHLLELLNFVDIVHFHWMSGLLDYSVLKEIPANKPIVWTLHDMHPFTGGCHYSEGCMNFKQTCSHCPLLQSDSLLAKEELAFKISALKRLNNLQIITPSLWLKNLAEQSSAFKGRAIHHVPNIMPIDVFKQNNQIVSRIKLGLPASKKLLLFGADNITSLRKGGDILEKVANQIQDYFEPGDIEVVFFGNGKLDIPFKAHHLGHIKDKVMLSYVYSAADVFIFPSREDNAPMSLVEAMLCGTPVVASDVGNARELIRHKCNGYLANSEDVMDFCEGIKWLFSNNDAQLFRIQCSCRNISASYHNETKIVEKLHSIYESALSL